MKLVYPKYQMEFMIRENQIIVISVENPKAYSDILCDMWNQSQGGAGDFILSDCEKVKNISKEIECVFNPFNLNLNDKKIINKLHSELKDVVNDGFVQEFQFLNTEILGFLDKTVQCLPYSIEYDTELDLLALFKVYGVQLENYCDSLLEKIVEYLKAVSSICGIRIFVFVGIKQYLSTDDLEKLYEFVFYGKIQLIVIEPFHSEQVQGEKCYILDNDLCIIEI